MVDVLNIAVLVGVVILQVLIVLYGIGTFRRTAGGLRSLTIVLIIAASLFTLRSAFHSGRYLLGLGLQLHLLEHVAIVVGVLALALASWKVHRIVRGAS